MQLWWRLWSLLTSAEGLVLLCSSGYSRNQATPEEQLGVIFPLFSSWLLGASQSPAGIFHLAVGAGCVDKYSHTQEVEQEGLCVSLFRLVWTLSCSASSSQMLPSVLQQSGVWRHFWFCLWKSKQNGRPKASYLKHIPLL